MLSLFHYLSVTLVTTFGNWDSSSARFARRRTLGENMEVCTKFPTARKNIHILAYFAHQGTLWDSLTLHPKTQKRMKNVIKREQCKLACGLPSVNILSKVSKFKVLLYLKKSGLDKQGKAPIMGRITLNNSMAQFSWKLSCNPKLDPATNRYSVNFSSEEDIRFLKMFERSGMTSKSAFIKARIFGEPFHVEYKHIFST